MVRYLHINKLIFLFFIFSLTLFAGTARIMPLGDSITYDNSYTDNDNPRPAGVRTAYRSHLWYKLQNAHYNVNFVGSRVAGQDIVPAFDPDNEGYPGWTSYEIADKTYMWMQNSNPDIVLLHAGSNDWDESPSGIEKILNEIDRYERDSGHSVTVVLALIINRESYVQWVTNFNGNVRHMAEDRIANGDRIRIVDMENGAVINYSTEMRDPAHPTDGGYVKMAVVWFDGLTSLLEKDDYAWLIPIYNTML